MTDRADGASRTLAFAVFTILAASAILPVFAATARSGFAGLVFGLAVALAVAVPLMWQVCLAAPDGRHAWGRGSLVSGGLLIGMPLPAVVWFSLLPDPGEWLDFGRWMAELCVPSGFFLISLGLARLMALLAFGLIVPLMSQPRDLTDLAWSLLTGLLIAGPVVWLAGDGRAAWGWGSVTVGLLLTQIALLSLPFAINRPLYILAILAGPLLLLLGFGLLRALPIMPAGWRPGRALGWGSVTVGLVWTTYLLALFGTPQNIPGPWTVAGPILLVLGAGLLLTRPHMPAGWRPVRAWAVLATGLVLAVLVAVSLSLWTMLPHTRGDQFLFRSLATVNTVAWALAPVLAAMGALHLIGGRVAGGPLRRLSGWACLGAGLVLLPPFAPGIVRDVMPALGAPDMRGLVAMLAPTVLPGLVLTVSGVLLLRGRVPTADPRDPAPPAA